MSAHDQSLIHFVRQLTVVKAYFMIIFMVDSSANYFLSRAPGDVFRCRLLSDQQFKTQNIFHLISYKEKAASHHILEAALNVTETVNGFLASV